METFDVILKVVLVSLALVRLFAAALVTDKVKETNHVVWATFFVVVASLGDL